MTVSHTMRIIESKDNPRDIYLYSGEISKADIESGRTDLDQYYGCHCDRDGKKWSPDAVVAIYSSLSPSHL